MVEANIVRYGNTQSTPADPKLKPRTSMRNEGISDRRVNPIHPYVDNKKRKEREHSKYITIKKSEKNG
jgi:hypothetical protein